MPFHASRSTRSSCSPRSPLAAPSASAEGRPTPSGGGMKFGGGALIADGAMRDWRICARDDRMAMCIACSHKVRAAAPKSYARDSTHVEASKVLVRDVHELLRALPALRQVVLRPVRLGQREQRHGGRREGQQPADVLQAYACSARVLRSAGENEAVGVSETDLLDLPEGVYLPRSATGHPDRVHLLFAKRAAILRAARGHCVAGRHHSIEGQRVARGCDRLRVGRRSLVEE